ncbi:hypothetical protein Moror_12788 [Moniliophthora roreri MCA 2997]|uniref:F-box domain-containing protein n=1 Tax=Moniliophthora roreri (strain MCA 2997) TaxID=1381753 RepID=V2X4G2_MONRO|nr:hypothetical protein Moror_12788 [Moniliophthora roreri MCA 2997]
MIKTTRKNKSQSTDQETFVVLDSKIKELERLEKQAELEVVRLRESRRMAKSHRNSLTPICSLPPEVLATIFSFTENSARRFRILRVCRYWRIVGLGHPSLWSRPDFTRGPQLAAEMIKHSKRAPLTVRWQHSNEEICFQELANMLRGHLLRIAELQLEVTSRGSQDSLQTLSQWLKRAPTLRTLSIEVSPYTNVWNGILWPGQGGYLAGSPAFLLKGVATPRLSSLSLKGCYIPWNSAVFRDLTFLQIRLGPGPNSLPTMEQLLVALTRCPKLEYLDLENCLPTTLKPTLSDIVPLPNLRNLRLSSTPSQCMDLMNSISFEESSAKVVLKWESSDNRDIGELHRLLPSLLRMFPREERPVRSLSLKLGDPGTSFILDASTSTHNGLSTDPANVDLTEAGELHFYFKRPHVYDGRELFTTLPQVFDALDIADLAEFSLSGSTSWFYQYPNFVKPLGQLSNLQVIHLSGPHAYQFVSCFCQLPDVWSGCPSTLAVTTINGVAVTFPALRTLHIQEVDLHHYRSYQWTFLRCGFLQALQDTLMLRWELGIELHSLRISDCTYLRRHELKKIEEVVVDVMVSECDILDSTEEPLIIESFGNTPRHYCAIDYQYRHKNATQQKFNEYWSEIEGTPAAERYEKKARDVAQAQALTANTAGTANVNTQNLAQNQNSGAKANPRTRKGGKRRKRR